MNILRYFKRNYLIRLVLSLSLLTVFITAIMGAVLLDRANSIMISEMSRDGQYNLGRIKDYMELNILKKYQEYYYNRFYTTIDLAKNQDIKYFLENENIDRPYRIVKIQDDLNDALTANPGTDNITFVFLNQGISVDSNYFYQNISGSPNKGFIEQLDSQKMYRWFPREYRSFDGSIHRVLTCIYPFNSNYAGKKPKGYMFIDISTDYLKMAISKLLIAPDMHFYILNENKKPVIYNDSDIDEALLSKLTADFEKNGSIFKNDKKNNMVISYISGTDSSDGLAYMSFRPVNSITISSGKFKNEIIIVCIIVIIIGLVISYLLSKSFYSPIRKIMDNIKTLAVITQNSWNNNEYSVINDTIIDMKTRINVLQNKVKDKALLGILTGNSSDLEDMQQYETNGMYLVAEVHIHRGSMQKFKEIFDQTGLSMDSRFIITDRNQAAIINLAINTEGVVERMTEKFMEIMAKAKDELAFSVGIGSVVSSLEEVQLSYVNARYSARYIFLFEQNVIVKYDEVIGRKKYIDYFDYESIRNILKSGQVEAIDQYFTNYYNATVGKDVSIESIELSLTQFVVILSKILIDFGLENIVISSSVILNEYKQSTFYETVEWLKKLAINIGTYIGKDSRDYHSSIINELKEYIDENLSEDISLDTLSGLASLSTAYISTLFSDILKVSFTEYLTQKRLEKAAELLAHENITVTEVSSMVGYNNSRYFCTKFKVKYGVSPMQYRNSQQG